MPAKTKVKKTTKKKKKKQIPVVPAVQEKIGQPEAIPEPKTMALVSVDPQALLAQAIDKGLPLESIERLLAMRRELKAEWSKERFFDDLSKFQAACPIIGKSKLAQGKKFDYKYAPLDEIIEQVKEPLQKFGFSYTIVTKQTEKSITAICNAHHADGHTESSEVTMPIDVEAYMNDDQKIASAMTYATRYAFRNAFGIVTGDLDDDGVGNIEKKGELRPPQAISQTEVTDESLSIKGTKVGTITGKYEPAIQEARDLSAGSPPRGVYIEIMTILGTSQQSKEGPMIALFGTQEKIEWKTKTDTAKANPEELKDVLKELDKVAESRRKKIKEG